jgi:hypothetical protein
MDANGLLPFHQVTAHSGGRFTFTHNRRDDKMVLEHCEGTEWYGIVSHLKQSQLRVSNRVVFATDDVLNSEVKALL